MTGYRNLAEKPKWEATAVPKPSFDSMAERQLWEEAMRANPRQPGEEAWMWLDRVVLAAKSGRPARLPYREPGSDDGEE